MKQPYILAFSTSYLQHTLRDYPSFMGLGIDQVPFADQLDHTLNACMADPSSPEQDPAPSCNCAEAVLV